MSIKHQNLNPMKDGLFMTDGGLETTLIFHEGYELNHFASFELLNHQDGRESLKKYYQSYIAIAEKHGLNLLLEAPTWRANRDWGYKLGYEEDELFKLNQFAVEFMQDIKKKAEKFLGEIPLAELIQ